jgi:heme/copper-type cytochrome/quinol oxidase subunit 2
MQFLQFTSGIFILFVSIVVTMTIVFAIITISLFYGRKNDNEDYSRQLDAIDNKIIEQNNTNDPTIIDASRTKI